MPKARFAGVVLLAVLALFSIGGCGGGDSAAPPSTALKQVSFMLDNAAPDYSTSGATCFLNVNLYYDESIPQSEIAGFVITSPTGWHWTATTSNLSFHTASNGAPYLSSRMWFGQNPQAFPLAGSWTIDMKLNNVATSSYKTSLHEPGSTAAASHSYLYTQEDWSPQIDQALYVAALKRFPSQGYQVQFSAANGGQISSTGLSAVRAAYLASEPRTYNGYIWLFDASENYLGVTNYAYYTSGHASTGLITPAGELSIVPAAAHASAGLVNLADVKYLRFVITDGAQYAPNFGYDHRSISSLVPVN